MNILIDINHPAQVHLFKNLYQILIQRGHKVIVTVKEVPVAIKLLELFDIEYFYLGKKSDSLFGKGLNQIKYNVILWRLLQKEKIDIALGSSITVDQAAVFSKAVSLHFSDDDPEVVPLVVKYAYPFSDVIICPNVLSFSKFSKKVIRYPGYHELAYLHPNRFVPNPVDLFDVGINTGDTYFIMRFNEFKAHHDVGIRGLSLNQKIELISILRLYGKVFITTEGEIESEIKEFQIKVSLDKMHSLIAYATLLIGDSQTMTSEAAVLGVPSLRCNSFAGRISYIEEEEKRYGLTYSYLPSQFESLKNKLQELLSEKNLKDEWKNRRLKMLQDKIDVTSFMTWYIERWPNSNKLVQNTEEFWCQFR